MTQNFVRRWPRCVRAAFLLAALSGVQQVHATAQAAAPAATQGVTGGGMTQAILGMAVVLALIFACAWLARRLGLQRLSTGNLMTVVASTRVGQRERVVVVEIAGTWMVLGVTPNQINALHTLPAQPAAPAPDAPAPESVARTAPKSYPVTSFASQLHRSLAHSARIPAR